MLDAASTVRRIRDSIQHTLARVNLADLGMLAIGMAMAIAIRIPLLPFRLSDFFNSLRPWYALIRETGFSAFAANFTTYNPPYLYALYLIGRFFPNVSNVLTTKIPSLITDFICACFVYKIVALKYPTKSFPVFAWLAAGSSPRHSVAAGLAVFATVGVACVLLLSNDRARVAAPLLLRMALASALLFPFFVPEMQDRYYYGAGVLAILYAFWFPPYFFVPVAIVALSFLAYYPAIFGVETLPMGYLAAGMFVMLLVVAKDAITSLFSEHSGVDALETQ